MTVSNPAHVSDNWSEAEREKATAEKAVAAMLENDLCTKSMGMEVLGVGKGIAKVSMPITQSMLNGHSTCHGGMLFTLADTAFAFACNSENLAAVASGCSIEYIRPAFEHDVLTAIASVKSQGKLTGTYDVEIVNQNQKLVALFRGNLTESAQSLLRRTVK